MRTSTIGILCLLLLMISCEIFEQRHNTGTFPDKPVNMGDINSEYDDYNSTSPTIGGTSPLCFSSKRKSKGADFDIVYKLLNVWMEKRNGNLTVSENTSGNLSVFNEYSNILNGVAHISTSYNEIGPYLIPDAKNGNGYTKNRLFILLYSNNETGNQDIRYVHNLDTYDLYTYPKPVTWLNSAKEDAYPALDKDSTSIYFCSDREGDFEIYRVSLDTNMSLRRNFEDTLARPVHKVSELNSPADDKCPFVLDDLMIFASNREGGFGGYDLYYSMFSNGLWSEPVNFGDKINTKYDEFRPIVKPFYEFTNDFMIFSSNRPGGKGGFDLYYVGIDKVSGK